MSRHHKMHVFSPQRTHTIQLKSGFCKVFITLSYFFMLRLEVIAVACPPLLAALETGFS